MSGIYGTVKPANINIENDVEIFYNYRPNRGYENLSDFIKMEASNLIKATDGTTTIDGLYNLKLPLSIFGKKGIYTIYIKPKEITIPIYAIGNLYEYSDVRGVIFQTDGFTEGLRTDGALIGYRIQYGEDTESFTRLITSSNICEVLPIGGQTKFRLYSKSGNAGSSNGRLIFCTVTPSAANGFNPNAIPSIGEPGQMVKVVNTKFNPIMLEIEMVDYDIETLSYMIGGSQVRNLENGTFTIYNDNNEIYKQYEAYTIKTQLGKPLYDVKVNKEIIDTSENYNNVIEG